MSRLLDWEGSDPQPLSFEHHDCPLLECLLDLTQVLEQDARLFNWSPPITTKQDEARQRPASASEELAEIGVGAHQYSIFVSRDQHQLLVTRSTFAEVLDDVNRVVSSSYE